MSEGTVTQAVRRLKVEQETDPASWIRPIVAIILFFPTGCLVLAHTITSRSLRAEGRFSEARVSYLKARHWMQNTVVILISLLVALVILAMLTANDFSIVRRFFDVELITEAAPRILKGFWLNVQIFMVAEVAVLVWSLVVAVLRSLPGRAARPIRFLMICYVDLFRGLPELIIILLIVYGLHQTGLPLLSELNDFWAIVLAITLTFGAYLGETMRGAMDDVHPSQVAAARSLGLSHGQALRYIVIPTAMRSITVPLINGFISLQKTTALVSIVGMMDSVNYAQAYAISQANLSALTGAALCFLIITVPLTRVADSLMKRDSQRVFGGGR
ncbi:MAG: ABC transporter permease subunit [Microbacterium sp.]